MRRPSTPSFSVRAHRAPARCGIDVESIGSWPPITSSSERGIGDRRAERTDLVEARRERDEPVAGDQPVGRLHADHAAERRGQADRAAGVGAERERQRSPRRPRPRCRPTTRRRLGWGRAGSRWARTPSSRSTSPSRTRRGSSCRPGSRRPRRAARPRSPCTAGASPRGCATSTSSGCRACTGCPSARPARRRADQGRHPRATRRSISSAAARASSAVTRLNALQLAVALRRCGRGARR